MSSLLSFLGGGKKSEPKKQAPDTLTAINNVQTQLGNLDKKIDHLAKQVDEQKRLAINYRKKSKKKDDPDYKRGMRHLKQSKMFQTQIDQQMKMQDNLQAQLMALQTQAGNLQQLEVMRTAARAMKNGVDADYVDEMQGEIEEAMEQTEQINDMLTRQMNFGTPVDEDDLEAEMAEMLNDDLDMAELDSAAEAPAKLPEVPSDGLAEPMPAMPDAPTNELTAEQKELEELMSFAS